MQLLLSSMLSIVLIRGVYPVNSTVGSAPTTKVLELLTQLETKMIAKAEASQKIYNEFASWCTKRSYQFGLDLKGDKSEQDHYEAEVDYDKATIETEDMKGDRESRDIAMAESDLRSEIKTRRREHKQFVVNEKELLEMISMLQRAIRVLNQELASGGTSMMQVNSATSLNQALDAMVQASVVSSEDAEKLTAIIQTSQEGEADNIEDNESLSAPAAMHYERQNHDILHTMKHLLDKATLELDQLRIKEQSMVGNFELLKKSLEAEISYSEEDKAVAHKEEHEATEEHAVDSGDLGLTVQEVQGDVKNLADLRRVCIAKVEEFTSMHSSRDQELKALADAKKAIQAITVGVLTQEESADDTSDTFLQVASSAKLHALKKSSLKSRAMMGSTLSNNALSAVRKLARTHRSHELAQLASRMNAVMRVDSENGGEPLAKVAGMISNMIEQLEAAAGDEAEHKAYCDDELKDSKQKEMHLSALSEKLAARVDIQQAHSAQLKRQVRSQQAVLSVLEASQAEMDAIRRKEHDEYISEKEDLDQGVESINVALQVLQEYYYGGADKHHKFDVHAARNIVGLLEVIESDFSKSLAQLQAAEEIAVRNYKEEAKDNEVTKVSKERIVQLKTRTFLATDKALIDTKSDHVGVQNQLGATKEYIEKLKSECTQKASSYEDTKLRREAEIAGLKEALESLESETAL